MKSQEQSNWCWAAVGSSVHKYLPAHEDLSQSDVSYRVDGDNAVFDNPGRFNKVKSLRTVLTRLNNLLEAYPGKVADFDLIQRDINVGCPIAARIA